MIEARLGHVNRDVNRDCDQPKGGMTARWETSE